MGTIDVSHEGRHESLLADFEKRQKARKIAVSTDDKEVKATLRLVFTILLRKNITNLNLTRLISERLESP